MLTSKFKISLLFALNMLMLGCGNSTNDNARFTAGNSSYEAVLDVPATRQSPPAEQGDTDDIITKKVIKTGRIEFESEDVETDYKKINELLPRFEGYIESENQNRTTQRVTYNLTVRVPSPQYDSLYSSITNLDLRLVSKNSSIDDVTGRYYDLKTRIKNKKALEMRYVELLEKAKSIKDILDIESKLNEVRTEIEQLQGQFDYLSKQIGMSTLEISFYELLPYSYDKTSRKGFGARLLSALDNGWQGFLLFLVGLTTLWPFIILMVIFIWAIRRTRNRRRKATTANSQNKN